ncbi:TRAP transporter substrate-binding protein [Marinomonas primoryensis]|uniref:TRAP-type C4-dicarboxylate transport system periplasmic protein DctP n=1 Tax=Marinomonas primoryensis TaxID=178399 RepID=A0A859CUW0_9GAMM|nr:TRAP transporter substrate-binding protein [Marinomonas primoryensis]QKK80156.1 TRAP-type C4-dicarboxylate transport system periplasmic protein DctP [Marinomonas primoryensis]
MLNIKNAKLHFASALLLGSLMGASSISHAETLKLSHNGDTKSPIHKALKFFADEVKEKSDGEIRVRVYPNGQLGTQRESLELLQTGALDMAKSNASELESFDPAYGAFNIPYIFRDREHFYKALENNDIGQKILRSSEKYGFVGLAYYDGGARNFYTTKPVRTPADLKGMKIRVQPSPSAIKMMQLMGASPTPLPFGELYTALQQGVVDGAENNIGAVTTYRHGEVAKYFSLDGHTMIPDVLVISSTSWEALSDKKKAILVEAGKASTAYMKKLWSEYTDGELKKASKMGVEIIKVDKDAFIKAVEPMHKEALENPAIAQYVKAIKALDK